MKVLNEIVVILIRLDRQVKHVDTIYHSTYKKNTFPVKINFGTTFQRSEKLLPIYQPNNESMLPYRLFEMINVY